MWGKWASPGYPTTAHRGSAEILQFDRSGTQRHRSLFRVLFMSELRLNHYYRGLDK